MKLVPLALRLERRPGPLLPQIHDALAAHGQPLRWAITSAQPATDTQGAVLLIEAVVRA